VNWRIRLAFWIAGPREIAEAASLEIISESRKLALEEAALICDDAHAYLIHNGVEGRVKDALEYAAASIRYRAAHKELFKQTLKERVGG
jgi:hypothetical protein